MLSSVKEHGKSSLSKRILLGPSLEPLKCHSEIKPKSVICDWCGILNLKLLKRDERAQIKTNKNINELGKREGGLNCSSPLYITSGLV